MGPYLQAVDFWELKQTRGIQQKFYVFLEYTAACHSLLMAHDFCGTPLTNCETCQTGWLEHSSPTWLIPLTSWQSCGASSCRSGQGEQQPYMQLSRNYTQACHRMLKESWKAKEFWSWKNWLKRWTGLTWIYLQKCARVSGWWAPLKRQEFSNQEWQLQTSVQKSWRRTRSFCGLQFWVDWQFLRCWTSERTVWNNFERSNWETLAWRSLRHRGRAPSDGRQVASSAEVRNYTRKQTQAHWQLQRIHAQLDFWVLRGKSSWKQWNMCFGCWSLWPDACGTWVR